MCISGHYVYVDASMGGVFAFAELSGTTLQPSSVTCQMNFWYHMYGRGKATI